MKFLVVCAVVLTSAFVHGDKVEEYETEDQGIAPTTLDARVSALEKNITENEMLSEEIPSLAMEIEKMNGELDKMDAYISKLYAFTKKINKEINDGKEQLLKSVKQNEAWAAKLPGQIEALEKQIANKQDKYSDEEKEKYLRGLWQNWKEGKSGLAAETPKKEEAAPEHHDATTHHHRRHSHRRSGGHGGHGGHGGVGDGWKQSWLAKKKQQWLQQHPAKQEASAMVTKAPRTEIDVDEGFTLDAKLREGKPSLDNNSGDSANEASELIFR